MATVNFIPESNQSISAMKAVIDYCLQQKKVADEESGRRLVGGVNCNGENSFTEFMVTKNAHKKKGGITFYHYVQSFSPRENVSAAQVHKVGLEFAEKAWPGHEVLVTTHTDAEHLHNHFVINSVHYENGNKLRQNPGTLTRLRTLSDNVCNEHGLSVLKPYKKDGANISSREYRAASKGESWKFKLIADIDFVMNRSGSRADFIREMNRLGYQVTWTDERKYITFTCPNGMKCRDIRLHDEKYLKGVLEYEFTIRKRLTAEHGNGYAEAENARTVSELERIPYLPQVYAIPIEQREKESKLLADAVEFQPKLYQLIEGLATREELTDHCDRIQNIEAEYMQKTVQWVMKTNADTVTQMQTMVEDAGKNQEQFILNCSETLSESTKALDSTIEKLQQKIMKIIIATAVSAVALSVLVCVVFWKLAV